MEKITGNRGLTVLLVALMLMLAMCLCGCKATKSVTDTKENHIVETNEMVSVEQGRLGESIDRQTVATWFSEWYLMQQQQTQQQDTEQVQETITTTTDSTGTTMRTEQRTTNRSTATQSTQNAINWGQQYQHLFDSLSQRIDSLASRCAYFEQFSQADSTAIQKEKESKPSVHITRWEICFALLIAFLFVFWLVIFVSSRQRISVFFTCFLLL